MFWDKKVFIVAMDSGYILNRRPFRDNSLIVDLLTKESGRMTCIARVAKKRGKIMKGTLEPFRLLQLDWIGRGQMQTLTLAEERGRYRIQAADLCKGLYLNELMLKLIPLHAPAAEIFESYQQALHKLTSDQNDWALIDGELLILNALGYVFNDLVDHDSGEVVQPHLVYLFSPLSGLRLFAKHLDGVPISGDLLIKLQQRCRLQSDEQHQLRQFLNRFIDVLLEGKQLKSRMLVFGR